MECQIDKENYSINDLMSGKMVCLSIELTGIGEWINTDNDCAQFCRRLGPEEFELVQINRYSSDTVFYTISHGTVCLQDYFMEQIDSILNGYGYQNLNYGTHGINAESTPDSQLVAEMVFETYFKDFEENECYCDYTAAGKCVREIISMR